MSGASYVDMMFLIRVVSVLDRHDYGIMVLGLGFREREETGSSVLNAFRGCWFEIEIAVKQGGQGGRVQQDQCPRSRCIFGNSFLISVWDPARCSSINKHSRNNSG